MPILNGVVARGQGPLIDLWIGASGSRLRVLAEAGEALPPPVRVRALLDTGASGTCIDEEVISQLGIAPTGMIEIHTPSTAGSPQLCPQYDVCIAINDPTVHVVRITLPIVASPLRLQGIDALIGRDVLDDTTLFYNGPAETFSWSI